MLSISTTEKCVARSSSEMNEYSVTIYIAHNMLPTHIIFHPQMVKTNWRYPATWFLCNISHFFHSYCHCGIRNMSRQMLTDSKICCTANPTLPFSMQLTLATGHTRPTLYVTNIEQQYNLYEQC